MKLLQANVINIIALLSFVVIRLIIVGSAYLVDDNPYRHFVTLDLHGKYNLEWIVNWNQKKVTFNVTVQTTGYVGFGLIRRAGKMTGADLVIGGVYPNGKSYFTDRHAIANQLPEIDYSEDWILLSAREHSGQTFLSFARAFDTCDKDHDLPITDDMITLIWAYGEIDDQVSYHFQNRGTYDTYLLDPDLTPRFIDPAFIQNEPFSSAFADHKMQVFQFKTEMITSAQDTIYWCTFHRVPTTTKHHIIGFSSVFETTVNQNHVHHLILHRCHAPDGVDPLTVFEEPTKGMGSECYFLTQPNTLPTQYCRETIYVWAVGGRGIFLPKHVGLPMSEWGNEYFMLQVHYDNPNSIPNLNISVQLDVYYTENIRENDVGMLQLGEKSPGSISIIIPPSSSNHVIIGHCAPGCMERIIPEGGVSVFASLLYTHVSGRGVRLLHHRGNQELKWISHDDNYYFNYQQFRILKQERRLLPGDHLMNKCVYDTTDRNESVVVGGWSTREEICAGILYYYPRSPGFALCKSEIKTEVYRNLLGIQNTTWNESRRQIVVESPSIYAGLSVADYAGNYIEWNLETREAIQRHHKFDPQVSHCPRIDLPSNTSESTSNQLRRYTLNGNRRFFKGYGKNNEVQADDKMEYVSIYPRGMERYRRLAQCSEKSDRIWKRV